ncbi:MAG: hypothetical protein WCS69_15845 [Ignavibacteriaceae bacterium]
MILFINIPKYRKRFNINNLVYVDFFNNMFSVILGFYLSAFLAIHIYNNQLEQKINDDKNNVLNYLTYLDENLREVNPDKLEEGVNMGYLNYDYFDNIQNIGNQNLNAKYFKLIGHLKYLKNTFYEVHNANLLNPKENPPRPDETKLINNTINYIKNDIKELRLGLL